MENFLHFPPDSEWKCISHSKRRIWIGLSIKGSLTVMCSSSWYGMHAWPGKVIRLWLEWNFWRFWLDQEFLILVHFARMGPCTPFTHLLGLKSEMLKLKITQLSSYFKINLCILNCCGDVLSNVIILDIGLQATSYCLINDLGLLHSLCKWINTSSATIPTVPKQMFFILSHRN